MGFSPKDFGLGIVRGIATTPVVGDIANAGYAGSTRLAGSFMLPGEGRDNAFTTANNITNPNVNIYGNQNPARSQPSSNVGNPATWGTGAGSQQGTSTTVASGNVLGAGTGFNPSIYRSQANMALTDLQNAYNTQQQALNRQFETMGNEAKSAWKTNQADYNTAVTGQNKQLVQQNNQIMQNTGSAYRNLMNMLGAYGAGGGSVAQQWAPTAAQNFQNAQMGAAGQNTAENLAALDTSWNRYDQQFQSEEKKREQAKLDQLANAEGSYEGTRSKLQSILDSLTSGTADSSVGSRLADIQSSIPNLKLANQVYTGNTPTYATPALSNYAVANTPAANFVDTMPGNSSVNSYYLADQQRRNTPALAALLNPRRNDELALA